MNNAKTLNDDHKATFAIYHDRHEVAMALNSLRQVGFKISAIHISGSKQSSNHDFSHVPIYQLKKGAVSGAICGALIGFGFGSFALGESLDNTILAGLIGMMIFSLLGAACGVLVGIGTPQSVARRYGQYLNSGGILFSIHGESPDQVRQAVDILSTTGGQDIHLAKERETWEVANSESYDLGRDPDPV